MTGDPVDVNVAPDRPVSSQENVAVNWVGFWFASRQGNLLETAEELAEDTGTLIACLDWRNFTATPRIETQSNYGYSLFIIDPAIANDLRDHGVVLVQRDSEAP